MQMITLIILLSVKSTDRFDLDTEIAINMQSLLDIYYMSEDLKLPAVKSIQWNQ